MTDDQAVSFDAVVRLPAADEPDPLRDQYEAAAAAVRVLYEDHALELSVRPRQGIRDAHKSLRRLAQLVPGLPLPEQPAAYGDLHRDLSNTDRVRQAREAQQARIDRYGLASVDRVSPGQEIPSS